MGSAWVDDNFHLLIYNNVEMNNIHVRQLKRWSNDEGYETNAHTHLYISTASMDERRFKQRTDDNDNSKDTNLHDITSGSLQFLYFFLFDIDFLSCDLICNDPGFPCIRIAKHAGTNMRAQS